MAKIDCSVTVNFLREFKRMCDGHEQCLQCALRDPVRIEGLSCNQYCKIHPDKAVEIIQKWSDEHQVKTRLDDIKERYPNVPLNGLGTPRFDPWMLGYCDKCSDCPHCIGDDYCWHEPLDGGATGKAVE